MPHHLYIIPALMEEWGSTYTDSTVNLNDNVRDPTLTIHLILNTVHVEMKLQQKATLVFHVVEAPLPVPEA